MRIVLQKTKRCIVRHEEKPVAAIGQGYVLLVCFRGGEEVDLDRVVQRVLRLRLFDGWRKDVQELGLELMILSQFTLYAQLKGRKPSFHDAERSDVAKAHFEGLVERFRAVCGENRIKCGIFGAKLEIDAVLDGPCTIILEM